MIHRTTYASPVGLLTLAGDGTHLTGLWPEGHRYFGSTLTESAVERDDLPVFAAARSWLDRYFDGMRPPVGELPLASSGTPFQQMIWSLLAQIPYGTVVTYGDLARQAAALTGKPSMSAQAVGGAVGRNPVSIIVPCHRVIGSNGSLTGYAGGLAMKVHLLEHEGVDLSRCFLP